MIFCYAYLFTNLKSWIINLIQPPISWLPLVCTLRWNLIPGRYITIWFPDFFWKLLKYWAFENNKFDISHMKKYKIDFMEDLASMWDFLTSISHYWGFKESEWIQNDRHLCIRCAIRMLLNKILKSHNAEKK